MVKEMGLNAKELFLLFTDWTLKVICCDALRILSIYLDSIVTNDEKQSRIVDNSL